MNQKRKKLLDGILIGLFPFLGVRKHKGRFNKLFYLVAFLWLATLAWFAIGIQANANSVRKHYLVTAGQTKATSWVYEYGHPAIAVVIGEGPLAVDYSEIRLMGFAFDVLIWMGPAAFLSFLVWAIPLKIGHIANQCPSCDYDLTGNETGKCPECGQMVLGIDVLEKDTPMTDQPEGWGDQVKCLECGHEIQDDQNKCPECGWTYETQGEIE